MTNKPVTSADYVQAEDGRWTQKVDGDAHAATTPARQHKISEDGAAEGAANIERHDRHASQATRLVALATQSGGEFWHSPEDETYATLPVAGHHETFQLRGKRADRWLRRLFYEAEDGRAPGSQAVADALGVLQGRALFDGQEHSAHIRIAELDGSVYIDLGDPARRAIEVTEAGWQVIESPPVRFRRARGMLALPEPAGGGCLDELRPFVNVGNDADFRLLCSWQVGAMHATGPYPVLVLNGEQGSAKSTTSRALRRLLDPSTAEVRGEPREQRDLMIAATNGWMVALDNLSRVRQWLSDALCRLATGGGFSTRELYSDSEEIIFEAQRPVILNGIEELATRSDLADRCLALLLPTIQEERRRPEAEFWRAFEAARPRILGAFLDALSQSLRAERSVQLDRIPRMADFALRASAAAPALGWTAAKFLEAYEGNRT